MLYAMIQNYIVIFLMNKESYKNVKFNIIKKLTDIEFISKKIEIWQDVGYELPMYQIISEKRRNYLHKKQDKLIDKICSLNLSPDIYRDMIFYPKLSIKQKQKLFEGLLCCTEFNNLEKDDIYSKESYIHEIMYILKRVSPTTEEKVCDIICSEFPLYAKKNILEEIPNFSIESIIKINDSIKQEEEKELYYENINIEEVEEESRNKSKEQKININEIALDILEELGFDPEEKGTKNISKIIEIIYHRRKAYIYSVYNIDSCKEEISENYEEEILKLWEKLRIKDILQDEYLISLYNNELIPLHYDMLVYEIVNNIIELYNKDENEEKYNISDYKKTEMSLKRLIMTTEEGIKRKNNNNRF